LAKLTELKKNLEKCPDLLVMNTNQFLQISCFPPCKF